MWSVQVKFVDSITPKYLKLDTVLISVSKIDNDNEETFPSFLLLPIIIDLVLSRFRVSLFSRSQWATLRRSSVYHFCNSESTTKLQDQHDCTLIIQYVKLYTGLFDCTILYILIYLTCIKIRIILIFAQL
jgi:hypothetical protein